MEFWNDDELIKCSFTNETVGGHSNNSNIILTDETFYNKFVHNKWEQQRAHCRKFSRLK